MGDEKRREQLSELTEQLIELTERERLALEHPHKRYEVLADIARRAQATEPIPMLLWCPQCGERHVDRGEFATQVHHTHACQECGMTWRPAVVPTVGVLFLPGFKDE